MDSDRVNHFADLWMFSIVSQEGRYSQSNTYVNRTDRNRTVYWPGLCPEWGTVGLAQILTGFNLVWQEEAHSTCGSQPAISRRR